MTMTTDPSSITLDIVLAQPPARVWQALTEPDQMAQWLMPPTDFHLAVGQHFTMQGTAVPQVNFDGTVYCQVLAFAPERMLRLSWGDRERAFLDTTVTWRLEPEDDGTHLFMEQAGYDPDKPMQQMSRKIMSGGWPPIARRLEEFLAFE